MQHNPFVDLVPCFAAVPPRPRVVWVPVLELAAALGVTEAAVMEVLPGTGARVAQMPGGSPRHELPIGSVAKVAASLGRPVPEGYPRAPR